MQRLAWPRFSLVQRLSLEFSAASLMVFSLIALLSYQHMQQILERQLQQQLAARIERMSVFCSILRALRC